MAYRVKHKSSEAHHMYGIAVLMNQGTSHRRLSASWNTCQKYQHAIESAQPACGPTDDSVGLDTLHEEHPGLAEARDCIQRANRRLRAVVGATIPASGNSGDPYTYPQT